MFSSLEFIIDFLNNLLRFIIYSIFMIRYQS